MQAPLIGRGNQIWCRMAGSFLALCAKQPPKWHSVRGWKNVAFHLGANQGGWLQVIQWSSDLPLEPCWVACVKKETGGGQVSKRTPGFVSTFDKRILFSAITQLVLERPPECRRGQEGVPIDGGIDSWSDLRQPSCDMFSDFTHALWQLSHPFSCNAAHHPSTPHTSVSKH